MNISTNIIRKIKIYFLTGNWEDPKVKKIIEIFDDIFSNMIEYYSDEYPKSIFYKHNDKICFELDFKKNITRCRYKGFWEKFKTEFELNDMEIKWLTHYMLGMHLKRWVPPTETNLWEESAWLGGHIKRKKLN